jgi:hypothetical protein
MGMDQLATIASFFYIFGIYVIYTFNYILSILTLISSISRQHFTYVHIQNSLYFTTPILLYV